MLINTSSQAWFFNYFCCEKILSMTDVHEPEVRSYNMSRIRSKDTKPEIIVRQLLHKSGLRFRLHVKDLPGKPDIVLPKYKTIIFINGCFWHGHEDCKYYIIPKTRTKFWEDKIKYNISRDNNNEMELRNKGWKVAIIWQCQLKADQQKTISELIKLIKTDIE